MDGEVAREPAHHEGVVCASELMFRAITGLPRIEPGDDLALLLCRALAQMQLELRECDVLVVTSKVVAKAENRYVDLREVEPSSDALALAKTTGKDPRELEVMLWDTERISRLARDVVIVRHHGGHVSANAGLDQSNARPAYAAPESGPWVLRLPADSDASAAQLCARLERHFGVRIAVVISDSFGRPFREGTVGTAVGVSGLEPLHDQRGRFDLYGRRLEHTFTATADQLSAAADLVCGQADESRPAVLVRGLRFAPSDASARMLCRKVKGDLYL
jgi:coenzyme F420-0:L-glutamate ligase/coenzyme F420-1:gamma-L-glutamate ligase